MERPRRSKACSSIFLGACAGILLGGIAGARADELYISYSNGDNYVEKFSSDGIFGDNTDLGPLPSTTTDTATPNGITFDTQGNLYVANDGNGTITEFAPNGIYLGVFASGLNQPASIAFDQDGNLYVANNGSGNIIRITPLGVSSVFASGLSDPQGLAFGPNGDLYVSEQGSNSIEEITPAGQISTFYHDGSYTIVNQVEGLAFDAGGNLYVASYRTNTIEVITPAGVASVFASNGDPDNPADPQGISNPIGLAFDSSGDLFVANFHHTQVDGLPYEGHGISYIDEFSSTGSLINAFTNDPTIPGSDPNLRDANYIAIKTNAGVPVLQPVPEPSAEVLMLLGPASLAGFVWIFSRARERARPAGEARSGSGQRTGLHQGKASRPSSRPGSSAARP